MQLLLELVIIAFLLLISIELLLIHRDLMHNKGRGIAHGDESPGQTINVNVGNPGTVTPLMVPSPERIEEKKVQAPVIETAKETVQEETILVPPTPRQPELPPGASVRSTSSGLIAKKCPHCKMENSSYRYECFNCGEKL
ncbi:MAG: hypothetical protein A3J97_08895 [Spirochaetes bacterium RIFOXYC1_FULL_54_7]|nr:MAG: hypothetical protein A3J97_08895 [Spirochaetes bacterium RIFOXYC1_FULL_54_7]